MSVAGMNSYSWNKTLLLDVVSSHCDAARFGVSWVSIAEHLRMGGPAVVSQAEDSLW